MANVVATALPRAVHEFRPKCPGCTPDSVTEEYARPCSYYDCPGLPSQLKVTCDTCMYDFAAGEGQIKCDHATCEIAAQLRANVATYRAWLELIQWERAR